MIDQPATGPEDIHIRGPVEYTTFDSSNLVAGLYDYGSNDLYIKFHGDRIYIYLFVPDDEWEGLINASSHGSYHYHNIRMDYPYEELTATDFPQQGRDHSQFGEWTPDMHNLVTA